MDNIKHEFRVRQFYDRQPHECKNLKKMNDEIRRKAIKTYYERSSNNSQINRDLRKKIRNAYGMDFCFDSIYFPSFLIHH